MLLTTKLKRSVILLASLLFAAILLGSLVSISTAMNLEPGNRNTDNGLKTTANEGLAVKSDAEIEANVNLAAMTIYTSGQNYLLNGDFSLLQYSGNYIKDGGFVSDNYINNGDFEELRPEHNLITNGDFSNGYASWTIVAGMTSGDTVGNPAPSAVFGVQGSSSDTNIIQQSFYAAEVGTMSISFDFYHNNPYTAHPQWRLYFEDKIIASGSAQNGTWGNYITYYTMEEPGTYTLESCANKPQYVGSARVDNVVVQINGEFPAEWEIASGMALGKISKPFTCC